MSAYSKPHFGQFHNPTAQWLRFQARFPLLAEIVSAVNGISLHTTFHYHLPIVLIWLKYCWTGRKIASQPSINSLQKFTKTRDNISYKQVYSYGGKRFKP